MKLEFPPTPRTSRHDGGTRREAKLTSGVLGAAPLIAWMQKEVRKPPKTPEPQESPTRQFIFRKSSFYPKAVIFLAKY